MVTCDTYLQAGAIWADLVPTVIALAVYFCIADFVLISQVLYYNHLNASHAHQTSTASTDSEQAPLLTRRRSSDLGLPGSHRRRSSALSAHRDSLSKILEEEEEGSNAWLKNSLSVVGVIAVGTAGWAIAWQSGVWTPTPENSNGIDASQHAPLGAEILGYLSAVCYLGYAICPPSIFLLTSCRARIPQIIKNHKDKSCEGKHPILKRTVTLTDICLGLSLLFFLLSLMGNLTYGAGIIAHSLEKEYIMTNLPWLIGSLGTMFEDFIIFFQFRLYAPKATTSAIEEART